MPNLPCRAAHPLRRTSAAFAHCAFQLQYDAGAPAGVLLAALNSIHGKLPAARHIWGLQWTLEGGCAADELQGDMKLREELLAAIASGQLPEKCLGNMMYRPGSEPAEA